MINKLLAAREKLDLLKSNRVVHKLKKAAIKFKPFSKKQKKILTWWFPKSPVSELEGIIADGAIRSGKTVSMSLSYIIWAMESFNGQNFGMCGKTIGSFRRNVLFFLKAMLLARRYKIEDKRADNMLIVTKGEVTNYFYIFGGKDERSQDLVQGITLRGCFFDEVALMPESFVNQATGRCSVDGSKWWFNCNPNGPYHWFKTNWIDKATEKGLLYLHFDMDDNLSLSEKIKQRYKNQYTGVFYKRYILGLWVAAEGVIYSCFDKAKDVIDAAKEGYMEYNVSVDYGTQNACVFQLWGRDRKGNHTLIKQYYYSGRDTGRQKTDAQYSSDLKEFTKNYRLNYVVVDPSATSFIAQLRKDGFRVLKAKNNVLDGIRLTMSLMMQDKIKFDKSCEELFKEFASYIWDEKAAEHGEDKPIKEHDHCCDALRYYCNTIIGNRPKQISMTRR